MIDVRKVSLTTFGAGVALVPLALIFAMRAIAGPRVNSLAGSWMLGRILGITAVVLLATSVVTAFLTPPDRKRKVWWAVPAMVILIVTLLFGWFVF
jgi:hypothetical protein